MKDSFLEKIVQAKRLRLNQAQLSGSQIEHLEAAARRKANAKPPRLFRDSISRAGASGIIAEYKRASPSKGIINDRLSPDVAAIIYESAGASAISVLTEEDFFSGSLDDLSQVAQRTRLPILRKDFFIDKIQIFEAALSGANAILLLAALFGPEKLREFRQLAESLGMEALVEVHNEEEMNAAIESGASVIGVNNRDLRSFTVSLDVSRRLIAMRPESVLMIAESGISSANDLIELRKLGYYGFLIGETFMRADNPEAVLSSYVRALKTLTQSNKS
ncbi:MAG: indole-3-glycerol phosphate synthase TrpC [Blastocatellia bacterium]